MKKFLSILGFVIGGGIPSLAAIYYLKLSSVKFIGSEFLLGYLGVFLGFAFSIVTFVMSVIEKLTESVERDNTYTPEEKVETKKRIKEFKDELFDTMLFLFFSFLFVVIVMLLEVWDIPRISIPQEFWYSKSNLLNAIKLSIFGFSVYGIYDLLVSTLKISERADKIRGRNQPTVR